MRARLRSIVADAFRGGGTDIDGCPWGDVLRPAGIDAELPVPFRVGVSSLALAMLGGAVLGAYLGASGGSVPGAAGLGLVAVAALPWAAWLLVRKDHGPSWSFAVFALVPLALLALGQPVSAVFAPSLGLGGELSALLASFPALLLALLYSGFAPTRMAVGVVVACYGTVAAPHLLAWSVGEPTVGLTGAVSWHMGFAFCVVAGCAVRFSHSVSRELVRAREALAWQAAAEERRRMAQDVHDVVAHTLAITMLHVTAARMAVRRSAPAAAEEALEEAERHGRASLADIRRIVRLLRGDGGADATPQPTLADVEALVDSYRAAGLPVDLTLHHADAADAAGPTGPAPLVLSPGAELAVYRVLQEALTNAVRHGAGSATVELRSGADGVALEIGNAVAARAAGAAPAPGSGLRGMRERVAAAGGSFEAGPSGDHWFVRARLPRANGPSVPASQPDDRPSAAAPAGDSSAGPAVSGRSAGPSPASAPAVPLAERSPATAASPDHPPAGPEPARGAAR